MLSRHAFYRDSLGRVIAPVALLVAGLLLALLAGIIFVSTQQTRQFDEAQMTLATDALNSRQTALLHTTIDYATWEDVGIKAVRDADFDWADQNVGRSVGGTFDIDWVLLLRPDGTALYAFENGHRVAQPPDPLKGEGLASLIESARHLPVGKAVGGSVLIGAGVALAAVAPLAMPGQAAGAPTPLLVFGQLIDRELLDGMSSMSSLPDLKLQRATPSVRTNVAVETLDGATIAHLVWKGRHIGRGLLQVALPIWLVLTVACAASAYLRYRRIDTAAKLLSIGDWRLRHNALTGLPNRILLAERMVELCRDLSDRPLGFAVLCLDLDGFKRVNDLHGHAAGDEVLCTVGERIRAWLGPDDVCARLGGDEFAILLVPAPVPSLVEDRTRSLMEAVERPIRLENGVLVEVGTTIGVTFAPQEGTEPTYLLRRADGALYNGKRQGKRRVCFSSVVLDGEGAPR